MRKAPGPALALPLLSIPSGARAQTDQVVDQIVGPLSHALASVVFYEVPLPFASQGVPFIVIWLFLAALLFTLYFGSINFRALGHGFYLLRGDYSSPHASGEVTHFQALTTALSGTVGLGNIAGVAIAISLGGPGVTFWMVIAGLLGMSTKFVECTLGVKYRNVYANGTVSGGPMYYLSKGIAKEYPRLAIVRRFLGSLFAIFCVGGAVGAGAMFQTNQAFSQLTNVSGGQSSALATFGWLYGVMLALFVGFVIIGGIRSIARVTAKCVPLMAITYVLSGIFIIAVNADKLPAAFRSIIQGAFQPDGVYGGILGVLIVGLRRATFSNEAGIGSAAIAHSAARTERPVAEGLVALYEPFIDTVIVCTITALIIIITETHIPGGEIEGIALTSRAFESVVAWYPLLLLVAVLLFSFSTTISWSYYGLKSFTYLFGEGKQRELAFKAIILASIVVGASIDLTSVMAFADSMILAMALPNLIGVYLLAPMVKRDLKTYWYDYKHGSLVTGSRP